MPLNNSTGQITYQLSIEILNWTRSHITAVNSSILIHTLFLSSANIVVLSIYTLFFKNKENNRVSLNHIIRRVVYVTVKSIHTYRSYSIIILCVHFFKFSLQLFLYYDRNNSFHLYLLRKVNQSFQLPKS